MFYKFKDTHRIKGHLTISKRFEDGSESLVYDDHNIIVSGMSVGLSHLFTGSGASVVTDYQIDTFQLGVSGPPGNLPGHGEGDTSGIYQLSGPLSSIGEYVGAGGEMFIERRNQIKNGVVNTGNNYFAKIPFSKVTRIDDVSVRYTLVVDKDSGNTVTSNRWGGGSRDIPVGGNTGISEVGLFMKNPGGYTDGPASILVAYRSFSPIPKTSNYALVFRWTINF